MRRVISRDGTSIAYERLGQGRPVILVTGRLDDGSENGPLARELATHFTIQQPTLVVTGGGADFFERAADTMAERIPRAERRTLENQSHLVDPQALAPVLERFFEG